MLKRHTYLWTLALVGLVFSQGACGDLAEEVAAPAALSAMSEEGGEHAEPDARAPRAGRGVASAEISSPGGASRLTIGEERAWARELSEKLSKDEGSEDEESPSERPAPHPF